MRFFCDIEDVVDIKPVWNSFWSSCNCIAQKAFDATVNSSGACCMYIKWIFWCFLFPFFKMPTKMTCKIRWCKCRWRRFYVPMFNVDVKLNSCKTWTRHFSVIRNTFEMKILEIFSCQSSVVIIINGINSIPICRYRKY